jgi:hypothetical protein
MALTQMQLIQSLGEAMTWFERELQWGVPATELRHLCGRIGELYAALITNGQMAVGVNQRGYDVVSALGERVSVKTTAQGEGTGHVSFNPRSFTEVDRIIVLRMNTDDMQIETLFDGPVSDALALMTPESGGKRALPLSRLLRKPKPRSEIATAADARVGSWLVRELESGTIEVERDGMLQFPVLPALRELAAELNVSVLNGSGNPFNTRQLGSALIRAITALRAAG